MEYTGKVIGAGTRLQAGIPTRLRGTASSHGILLRGVVIATYVSDDPGHPMADYPENYAPMAVYCDVLVFPSIPREQWFALKQVLVTQPTGGMHRGRVWKPRAATVDISQKALADTLSPGQVDGDHVLIGFLDNNWDEPIILRGLPHPAQDTGAENSDLGHRVRLKLADGDPDFVKHHGSFFGIDDSGNFLIDTTLANQGDIDSQGHEPAAPTDGKGTINLQLPENAKINLQINGSEAITIEESGGNTKIILGDGAVKVAIADHLESLYTSLISWLITHTHPDPATGFTGIPVESASTPAWNAKINSDKITCPDT